MVRLKQIQDKAKRNPVDSQAAKRLVKGSLWTPKDDSKKRSSEETRYVEIVAKNTQPKIILLIQIPQLLANAWSWSKLLA